MHILRCFAVCLLWPLVLPKRPAIPALTFKDAMIIIFLIVVSMLIIRSFESEHVIAFYILTFGVLYLFQGWLFYIKIVTEGLTKEEWISASNGLPRR